MSQSMGTRELKLLLQHIKRPKSALVDLQSDTNIVSVVTVLGCRSFGVKYLWVRIKKTEIENVSNYKRLKKGSFILT